MAFSIAKNSKYRCIYLVSLVCMIATLYHVEAVAAVTTNVIPVVSQAVRAVTIMPPCINMLNCSLYSSRTSALKLCSLCQASNAMPLTDVFVPVQRASSPLELLQETTAAVRHVTRSTQTAAATSHMDLLRQPTMLALHLISNNKVLSPFIIKLTEVDSDYHPHPILTEICGAHSTSPRRSSNVAPLLMMSSISASCEPMGTGGACHTSPPSLTKLMDRGSASWSYFKSPIPKEDIANQQQTPGGCWKVGQHEAAPTIFIPGHKKSIWQLLE